MTGSANSSIDGYLPHPGFTVRGENSPSQRQPLVSHGPPLAHASDAGATHAAANRAATATAATAAAFQHHGESISQREAKKKTTAIKHLEKLLKDFPWFSLKEINRPQQNNFAQLLFDDGLLHKSVSDYVNAMDEHDYVFDLTFHFGASTASEKMIREDGTLNTSNRLDLRECTWFQFSASQARSFGTGVVRARLERTAKICKIEGGEKSWGLLNAYYNDVVDTFARENRLSMQERIDLQNHLVALVLKEQGFDGVVMNHPNAGWKALLMLNADLMVLEFN